MLAKMSFFFFFFFTLAIWNKVKNYCFWPVFTFLLSVSLRLMRDSFYDKRHRRDTSATSVCSPSSVSPPYLPLNRHNVKAPASPKNHFIAISWWVILHQLLCSLTFSLRQISYVEFKAEITEVDSVFWIFFFLTDHELVAPLAASLVHWLEIAYSPPVFKSCALLLHCFSSGHLSSGQLTLWATAENVSGDQ